MKLTALLKNKIFIGAASAVVVAATAVTAAVILNKPEAYRVIKVFDYSGTASVERSDIGALDPFEGMNLQNGDSVSVFENSNMQLTLDDDKYITLEENTVIDLTATGTAKDSRTEINLLSGAVVNEITQPLSDNSVYSVKTPKAAMSVRGTKFRVEVEKHEDGTYITTLNVEKGKVALQLYDEKGSPKNEEVFAAAGDEFIIETSPNTSADAAVDGTSTIILNKNNVSDEIPDETQNTANEPAETTEENADAPLTEEEINETSSETTPVTMAVTAPAIPPVTSVPHPVITVPVTTITTTAPQLPPEAEVDASDESSGETEDSTLETPEETTTEADTETENTTTADVTEETTTTTRPAFIGGPIMPPVTTTTPAETTTTTAEQKDIFSVMFCDENGNVLGTYSVTDGETVQTVPTVPEKTGYTGKWITSDGEEYDPTMPIKGNATISAIYTINTYTVTFIADGTTVLETTADYNTTIVNIPDVPDKTGYTGKWVYGADNTEFTADTAITGDLTINLVYTINTYTIAITYASGGTSTVTAEYGTNIFEALNYSESKYYTLTYNNNGSTEKVPTDMTVTDDISVTYIENCKIAIYAVLISTDSDYNIIHSYTWYTSVYVYPGDSFTFTSSEFQNKRYATLDAQTIINVNDTVTITEDLELYPCYRLLSYTSDDGSSGKVITNSLTGYNIFELLSSVTLPEGYTWVFTDSDGNTVYADSTTEISADTAVTPALKQYGVSFFGDDGTELAYMTVEHGKLVPSIPDVPEKTGYTGKWVYGADNTEFTADTVITEDMQITAVYTPLYTLSFVYNGITYTSETYEENQSVELAPEFLYGYSDAPLTSADEFNAYLGIFTFTDQNSTQYKTGDTVTVTQDATFTVEAAYMVEFGYNGIYRTEILKNGEYLTLDESFFYGDGAPFATQAEYEASGRSFCFHNQSDGYGSIDFVGEALYYTDRNQTIIVKELNTVSITYNDTVFYSMANLGNFTFYIYDNYLCGTEDAPFRTLDEVSSNQDKISFTDEDGNVYKIGDGISVTKNLTLTLVLEHTVTFLDSDGTTVLKTMSVNHGGTVTVTDCPTAPAVPENYVGEWYAEDGTYLNNRDITVTSDTVVNYVVTRTYKVSFVYNGNTYHTEVIKENYSIPIGSFWLYGYDGAPYATGEEMNANAAPINFSFTDQDGTVYNIGDDVIITKDLVITVTED